MDKEKTVQKGIEIRPRLKFLYPSSLLLTRVNQMPFSESSTPNIDELKIKRDIDGLAHALSLPNEPQIRAKAIEALSELSEARAIEALATAIRKSYYYDVRRDAAFEIGKIRDVHAKEALVYALKDSVEEVRFTAAIALGEFGDLQAIDVLESAKDSKDKNTRERAIAALNKLKNLPRLASKETRLNREFVKLNEQMKNLPHITITETDYDEERDFEKSFPLATELNDKGTELAINGRYEEALKSFDKALRINPKFATAWFNKSLTLENSGQTGKALQCFNKVLDMQPKDAAALYEKARCEDVLGQSSDAILSYKKFLESSSGQMITEGKVARRRLEELCNASPKEAHKTITRNKETPSAKLKKEAADYFDIRGNQEKAIACYDKALEMNPGNMDAWYNKGIVLENRGDIQAALHCFRKVLEIDPYDVKTIKLTIKWRHEADHLDRLGRYNEAVDYYDRVLKVNPVDFDAWFNKGLTLEQMSQSEKALNCHNKILESNPKDVGALYRKACCEDKLNRKREAINSYDKYLRYTPAKKSAEAKLARKRIKELS